MNEAVEDGVGERHHPPRYAASITPSPSFRHSSPPDRDSHSGPGGWTLPRTAPDIRGMSGAKGDENGFPRSSGRESCATGLGSATMWRVISTFLERVFEAFVKWANRCLPLYQPGVWNDADGVQYNNNCYNYGCDMPTETYAQPGRAQGIILGAAIMNCPDVTNGAVADGLVRVNCDQGCGCSECHHQVAMAIWPNEDYHWYRRDRDGRWSHKMGWSPATNLDSSGNIITDPRTADRGPYIVFCGCFCVNKSKITIN